MGQLATLRNNPRSDSAPIQLTDENVADLTVMNVALPSAQRALHFTTVDRQWVVTA